MERDITVIISKSKRIYFNSHAHVERDVKPRTIQKSTKISTHTLTWSVTLLSYYVAQTIEISTHTLTWSVTR